MSISLKCFPSAVHFIPHCTTLNLQHYFNLNFHAIQCATNSKNSENEVRVAAFWVCVCVSWQHHNQFGSSFHSPILLCNEFWPPRDHRLTTHSRNSIKTFNNVSQLNFMSCRFIYGRLQTTYPSVCTRSQPSLCHFFVLFSVLRLLLPSYFSVLNTNAKARK